MQSISTINNETTVNEYNEDDIFIKDDQSSNYLTMISKSNN